MKKSNAPPYGSSFYQKRYGFHSKYLKNNCSFDDETTTLFAKYFVVVTVAESRKTKHSKKALEDGVNVNGSVFTPHFGLVSSRSSILLHFPTLSSHFPLTALLLISMLALEGDPELEKKSSTSLENIA